MKFTAVIITYNEERNIERCLKSLVTLTDDIVVMDSFSTDSTPEICKRYGVGFFQHEFLGYSDQKNRANEHAKYDYIFSVDADEEVSQELADSIRNFADPEENISLTINRLTNYCGKWIRHCGWYPDSKTRIWNRNYAHWEGYIHEWPVFTKPAKNISIKGDLLHFSYYTIDEHLAQSLKFTKMKTDDMKKNGKTSSVLKLLFAPGFKFLNVYFLKLGFLDGFYGFIIAKISTHATFYKNLWLLQKSLKS